MFGVYMSVHGHSMTAIIRGLLSFTNDEQAVNNRYQTSSPYDSSGFVVNKGGFTCYQDVIKMTCFMQSVYKHELC